jgi:hypothetical protein
MLFETIIAVTAILVVIGLPMAGFIIRFALRPLVQDIANAIRSGAPGGGDSGGIEALNDRLDRIERSLLEQEAQTSRLLDSLEFDRQITRGDPGTMKGAGSGPP